MSDRFPIAVLGVGPAGRNYLRDLLRVWDIEVVAFANRSADRRAAVAAETGVPGFSDLAELLGRAPRRPRVVVIASANPTHEAFTIEAMEAGLDVFCEKPMAMSLAGCRTMLDAERRTGRLLQIGFEYRYGTLTARVKELLDEGFFGELRSLDITDSRGHWWPERPDSPVEEVWRLNPERGGGPIVHCGIHELDLLRHYGGEVTALQAFVPPRSIGFYPAHAPDHVNIQVRFASGASGSFTLYHTIAPTWYRSVPPHNPNYHAVPGHGLDFALSGSAGSGTARIYQDELHLNRFDAANRETVYVRTERNIHQHPNAGHHNTTAMIVDFCRRLRTGQGVLHSAADSLRTTALGFAAEAAVQEAMQEGWSSRRWMQRDGEWYSG